MAFEIWKSILYNLGMVAWFMLPLILCRISDIVFGSVLASKSISFTFDKKLLIKSILHSALMVFGLICFVSGIITLPEIMKFYNIDLVNTDTLKELVNILMVATLLIGATVTYGKDSYEKLVQILRGNPSK